jgi:putative ATP-dependent endonuclease of the OLD family
MFFAPYVVFVEGDEDRAILSKYLELSGLQNELLAMGTHIVPTHGKGNMINALSIAKGFGIPYFVIFDADMSEETNDNRSLNRNILKLVGYGGSGDNGALSEHLAGKNFFAWRESLQDALRDSIPEWDVEMLKVCQEFGWTISRLRKNAMVLEAALDRVYKQKNLEQLHNICLAILSRFGEGRHSD